MCKELYSVMFEEWHYKFHNYVVQNFILSILSTLHCKFYVQYPRNISNQTFPAATLTGCVARAGKHMAKPG